MYQESQRCKTDTGKHAGNYNVVFTYRIYQFLHRPRCKNRQVTHLCQIPDGVKISTFQFFTTFKETQRC